MKESSIVKAWESTGRLPWSKLSKDEAITFTLSFITQIANSLIEVARMPNFELGADAHNATVKMLKAKAGPAYESEHDELLRLRREIEELRADNYLSPTPAGMSPEE